MREVDRLFEAYKCEHGAGGDADPRGYLARASPENRRELEALIDGFLARASRREFDAGKFQGSTAERTVDELERVLGGQSGFWPSLLPRLRARAGLKRRELVERLATALEVSDKTEEVAAYYHQMEQGRLPSTGVSARVLQELGRILATAPEQLREAGRYRGAASVGPAVLPAFTRLARGDSTAGGEPPAGAVKAPEEWDEVDRLFRGG